MDFLVNATQQLKAKKDVSSVSLDFSFEEVTYKIRRWSYIFEAKTSFGRCWTWFEAWRKNAREVFVHCLYIRLELVSRNFVLTYKAFWDPQLSTGWCTVPTIWVLFSGNMCQIRQSIATRYNYRLPSRGWGSDWFLGQFKRGFSMLCPIYNQKKLDLVSGTW